MPSNQDTAARILDGALRGLARHGRHKLSMSDICREAHVSRGTLYRYFKTKDDVLDAIGKHVETSFRRAVDAAVAANPAVEDRLRVVLEVMVDYGQTHEAAARVVESEPQFTLAFLRREFPNFITIMRKALEPVLDEAAVVRDGVLTKNQLVELFLRIALSTHLVPSPGSSQIAKRVADLWGALTRSARPEVRPRSAARAVR
ncbi:MAG: TetR/AcrR family transcriptional regulator [Candidatus Binatia bacterium]